MSRVIGFAVLLAGMILTNLALNVSAASSFEMPITTSSPTYDLGEEIVVIGNLTLNGELVTDGLVTVQVNDPSNETILIRTLSTGTDPPKPWIIEILEFFACDQLGNPKYSFKRGGNAGFKVTIKNNALSTYSVKIPIYVQYSDGIPFTFFTIFEGTIEAQQTIGIVTWPVPIPSDAPLGETSAYANVLTDYPISNGYAYSPEKKATFQITLTSSTTNSMMHENLETQTTSTGMFNITFRTSPHGGMLGNYTAYASSKYSYWLIKNQTTFKTVLIGDVTGSYGIPDGKVDIKDVSTVARAYGSYPGHPKWDSRCDLNGDDKVDIKDMSLVSRNFGKYGTLP